MAGPRRLTELVSSALERLSLPHGDLVAALSGGADSAAMSLLTQRAGRSLRTLHVDHRLPNSPMMRKAAESVAGALGIELTILEVEVGEGPSPEGQARSVRYQAFAQGTTPDERILTAHTAEDSVETVLLNMIRGTGPTGLAGIPRFRPPNIYRPMLGMTRSETRELAALAGLDFADDPMNADPTLTRNLLRREILPALRRLNPSVVDAVTRASRLVGADDSYLDDLATTLRPQLRDETAVVAVGSLVAADPPLADRALTRMLGHVVGRDQVDSAMIARAWSVVSGESARQEMADGVWAKRSGPMLVILRSPSPAAGDTAVVDLLTGRPTTVGDFVLEVTAHDGVCQVAPLSKWSALFPAGTDLEVTAGGVVLADGEEAWVPGEQRLPVAWYQAGSGGYLVASARRKSGWTSSP